MRKLLVAMMCVLAISGHAQTSVTINTSNRLQTVEGWGVSLCWWAAQAGQWDDAKINEIADWLVSPDGLNYNVFRYNIPGGDDPDNDHCTPHHMQSGKGLRAEMKGFIKDKHAPGDWDNWVYDWTADEAQIKMLCAIVAKAKEYGKEDILKIEAFSNSCPWWMTVSGCVSGSEKGGSWSDGGLFGIGMGWNSEEQETNLKFDYYADFAKYLIDVCKYFKEKKGIEFYTIEPFNEPYANNYWTRGIIYPDKKDGKKIEQMGGQQEGCYVKPADQIKFVNDFLAPELANSSLNTVISVSDETNLELSAEVWDLYAKDAEVMSKITQWNTHTYDGSDSQRTNLRDKVKTGGKRLWMSETGDMSSGASEWTLCKKLFDDMRNLQPVVWCDWQVMEPHHLWSTIQCGGSNNEFDSNNYWRNLNYYVRKQVTSNIKVGYTILSTSNANVLAAVSPEDDEVVVCFLNNSSSNAIYKLDVSTESEVFVKRATITTSSEKSEAYSIGSLSNISVPKQSIVTVVVSGYFSPKKAVYLRNRATGRYLMNGGWWGSHAVVGNYPKLEMTIRKISSGKYDIYSQYGHLTDAAYVDNNNAAEYITEWELIEKDDFFVLSYEQDGVKKALTADDPTYFNDNPLYCYATTAPLYADDKHQQWELVTEDMLNAEIAKATADNPVNVTHYIKSANFDRIDWGGAGWTFDNKGNNRNDRVKDNGVGGIDNDAYCNFNRSVNTQKYGTSSANQWDCYQELNVPAGYYMVTCQAFAKGVTNCGYFYAWSNPEGSYKEEKVLLNVYNAADFTEDTQVAAGRAFDAGKYTHKLPIIKVGNDGHLVVGVKKTENNSTAGWFVFDNFQLYYLGAEKPNREYDYDVIGSTRAANINKETKTVTLTGTWREVDMKEITGGPTTGNLEAELIANKSLLLDASSNNFLICRPEIQTANAPENMMIKVADAADVANTQNVIADGKCANFVVTDKKEFGPQQEFTAQKVSYARSNTQGYNTVCMPFALTVNDFPETCTVYKYTRQTEDTAYFEEVGDDETIEAGTPVLVKDNTNAEGAAAKWEMNIVSSRGVVSAVSGNVNTEEKEGLNGSFLARTLGEGYFKLNSAGTKFVKTTSSSTITPFRFYLKEAVGGSAKAFDVVLNDEETDIEDIVNDPETKIEEIYDVSGRKVLRITRPGLYIMGGKKVLKR